VTATDGRLAGKRCLVTGGGTGIGRAVALRFAAEGARVIVNGRRSGPLENVAASHEGIGTFAGDVGESKVARELVGHTVKSLGGLDVLFHAAGVLRRNEVVGETTDAQWASDVAVNLTGTFNVVRAAIPALKESHGTAILVASQLAHIAVPGYATYCATKGGVLALTRALAVDLGPDGVRVNALSPGVVESDMAYIGRDFAAIRDQVAATIPLRRVGEPDDMAGPAVFLASDDSRWMTGQALIVDGGFTAQ
jgi:NAD(P)-dependent dehydrogenase (short-subunit alcohol dehydrogenase family)